MTEVLRSWSNGHEERISIDDFGKLNKAIDPIAINTNDSVARENFIKKVGYFNKLFRRFGIQKYNNNDNGTHTSSNLFEAKLNSGYYLINKETGGTSANAMGFTPAGTYTGSYTTIPSSATEYDSRYNICQFKNNIYFANRISSAVLQPNKVWTGGSSAYYEVGCNPLDSDAFTAAVNVSTTGGMLAGYFYFYIITFLYDGYQESSSLNYIRVDTTGGTSVDLASLSSGNTRIKGIKIYRSVAMPPLESSIPAFMYYLTTITDTTVTTYTHLDVKADEALGNPIPIENFFNQKRPYRSKLNTTSKGRLIQGNLEIASTKYSAISSGDLTVNEATAGALSGVYKYRLYKCFVSPSGGRFGFVVGSYVELTSNNVSSKRIKITLSNPTTYFDNWCNYILIERSGAGNSKFQYLTVQSVTVMASTGYSDNTIDATLATNNKDIPVSIVYAGQQTQDTKYKGSIAISDLGAPDLISGESVKQIDITDNQGIIGIYSEDSVVVIFTANGIFKLDTRALSTEFWTIDKVIDKIGASGQDTAPKTETIGHNGILQLPDGGGYIFFNKAYNASANNSVKIYYWSGGSEEPVIISNEINSIINTSLAIYGMCFDHINNWVWITCLLGSTQYILVYDIQFKEWYIFTFNNAVQILNDIICTEDGRILMSGTNGKIYNYADSTYQDNYGTSPTNYPITVVNQTKSFDFGDENINTVGIIINLDTVASTTTDNSVIIGNEAGTETPYNLTSSAGYRHKLKKRLNILMNRVYLKYTNAENKAIILEKISLDIKRNHKKSGGY